jgi:copper chaperone
MARHTITPLLVVMGIAAALGLGVGTASARAGASAHAGALGARADKHVTLKVEGMTCGGCAAAVKMAAEKVDGVKEAKVSHEKGTAEVVYDPDKTTPEAIAKAITEKSGFKASVPKPEARR